MEKERLIIRRFRPEDGADLYDYLSREKVVRFEPYGVFSREQDEREAARRADDEAFSGGLFKKNGKLISNLYLSEQNFETGEPVYVFNSDFWARIYF
ncbi:MAG TPA: GNAT family N-acetyltransferase [Oscillospiraceae bacterium]|nr:GNAT family N-acetyltransferase [Oscillospiraceae bacterium]HPS35206.1 GNAT family N-acetyltransferase [Oscillospiraceae bacterium]